MGKTIETKRANCHFCGYLCGFLADVEDGKVVGIKPDSTRYPYDERILAGCRRWKMNLAYSDAEDRIDHPLRRVGKRGDGKWEQISWDEAINEISDKLAELRERYGPGTLASMIGGPHTSFWPLHRFMSLFGSPNNVGIGQICWNPRIWMDAVHFGWTIEADITDQTNSVFIWGTNPAESDNSAFFRTLIHVSKSERQKLVVVDPRYTRTAALADLWIAPNPGTDVTLMLSMANVIIERELFDKQFVSEWCSGFEELAEYVRGFSPEIASEVCGVDAQKIVEAAILFADSPVALVSGRGIDQVGKNVLPAHRARCILLAITGNLDVPGSNLLLETSDFVPEVDLELSLPNSQALASFSLNTGVTPLQSYDGFAKVKSLTERFGNILPMRYLTSAHPDLVLKAMEEGKPYRISALIVEATNPLLTYADTHRVYEAFMGLDLIVTIDYFLSPTAMISDYVLPSAASIERATFQAHGGVANIAYGGARAVDPYYDRKSDYEIFRLLGMALGQAEHWPDETFEDAIATTLAPASMTFDEYCEQGIYFRNPMPYKHLLLDADGTPRGFATTTGKIELVNPVLRELGADDFPSQAENRKCCSDGFIKEMEKKGFSHIDMITGARKQPYNASMYMNNPSFRDSYPYPFVEMSQATADELGLLQGDVAELATEKGNAFFKVSISAMRDGLVHADYGWWHPEWQADAEKLGGIWESNVNLLTSCSLDQAEPLIGTWSYNGLDCMIRKSDHILSWKAD